MRNIKLLEQKHAEEIALIGDCMVKLNHNLAGQATLATDVGTLGQIFYGVQEFSSVHVNDLLADLVKQGLWSSENLWVENAGIETIDQELLALLVARSFALLAKLGLLRHLPVQDRSIFSPSRALLNLGSINKISNINWLESVIDLLPHDQGLHKLVSMGLADNEGRVAESYVSVFRNLLPSGKPFLLDRFFNQTKRLSIPEIYVIDFLIPALCRSNILEPVVFKRTMWQVVTPDIAYKFVRHLH